MKVAGRAVSMAGCWVAWMAESMVALTAACSVENSVASKAGQWVAPMVAYSVE